MSRRAATSLAAPTCAPCRASSACNADGTVEQLATHRRAIRWPAQRPRLRARRPALVHRLRHRGRRPLRGAQPGRLYVAGLLGRRGAHAWSGRASTRTASPSTPRAASTGRSPWGTACAGSRTARRRRSRQLSDGHVPDGMAFAADGRLFVCTTISGGITVLSPEGEVLEEIFLGRVRDQLHLRRPDAVRHRHKVADLGFGRRPASSGASRRTPRAACR